MIKDTILGAQVAEEANAKLNALLKESIVKLGYQDIDKKHAILNFIRGLDILQKNNDKDGRILYQRKETEEKSKINLSVVYTSEIDESRDKTIKEKLMSKELESVLPENYFVKEELALI